MAKKPILKMLDPQLAKPWNEKAVSKVLAQAGYMTAQVKADGIRCLVTRHPSDGRYVAVSREGIEIKSLTSDTLMVFFNDFPYWINDDSFYIDCEVTIEGLPFEAISGHIRREQPLTRELVDKLRFNIFNPCDIDYVFPGLIKLLPFRNCESMEDIQRFYDECRAAGHEGIIVKDPRQPPYTVLGRKNGWWKMKPSETIDGTIVSIHQGTGKYEHSMGYITVVTECGITVDVGTGFTDSLRDIMFHDQGAFIGRLVEISYMEKTSKGSLRHPAYKSFRDLSYAKGAKL